MSPDTAILQLTQAKGLGMGTLDRVLKRLSQEGRDPEDLVMASVEELQRYGLRSEVATAVKVTRDEAERLSDELMQQGIKVLFKGSPEYPDHLLEVLGETAPPLLFAKGNLAILQRSAVGFTGSRKTSEKGLKLATDAAASLATDGINVVSGYASGTDLAAHRGALTGGGATTLVLVEGILNFRVKRELAEWLNQENYLAISEFAPRTRWMARNAMQRNRTICGLADAMILVESGLTGGTFAAGETTLELGLPLFVVNYAQPPESAEGNASFLDRGALPLRSRRDGHPNLEAVVRSLRRSSIATGVEAKAGLEPEVTVEPVLAPEPKPVLETQPDRPAAQTQEVARSLAEKQEEPMPSSPYPKRLIEVDLPIKRISAHARREKSIRHGHISTLHIWWARRPLAACRSVICAALWLDPVDPQCPQVWRDRASDLIMQFAQWVSDRPDRHAYTTSLTVWQTLAKPQNRLDPMNPAHWNVLRYRLLDLIADFANWDNSTNADYLEISRSLTQAAHEALGGMPGTKPLVVDPFAGGGSIPLEALRVGADAFASDLNPVAVLLNKVVLEYIPKYGQRLADEVRKWGLWVKEEAEKELAEFYPKDADGSTPIAYLWARTILSEAPDDGAGIPIEVPLMRSLWLAKKNGRYRALRWVRDENQQVQTEIVDVSYADGNTRTVRRPLLEVFEPQKDSEVATGTIARGSATCPVTGFTTPVVSVRRQLKVRQGGTSDARLFCVVYTKADQQGRFYKLASEQDLKAFRQSKEKIELQKLKHQDQLSLVPDEKISLNEIRRISTPLYGITAWGDMFTPRQNLSLSTLARLAIIAGEKINGECEAGLAIAVQTCLALAVDRQADALSSSVTWTPAGEFQDHTFARQALPIVWDFAEINPLCESSGNFLGGIEWIAKVCHSGAISWHSNSTVERASATHHPLPNDSAQALVTDPPYYDAVPYAHLSDFFYVWLRRSLSNIHGNLFRDEQVLKDQEIVVDRPHQLSSSTKDITFYEKELTRAFADARRVLQPTGIGTFVFASETTASWEAFLLALVDSGWTITGSWTIDTERESRLSAQGQARLASSIHIVCRPRENPDGSLREAIGDWRDVLQELPIRIHDWMPRLAAEGVVGADAIFACLGPALEIFSRYSRVEKASGEPVPLKEYLEYVWAAVSKEALSMIFENADTAAFEEDARLTAMWLWTLSTGKEEAGATKDTADSDDSDDEDTGKPAKLSGYVLEFDAARKIAQGLGAHLDRLTHLVEAKGEKARLLPVSDRAAYLLGKTEVQTPTAKKKKSDRQLSLLTPTGTPESGGEDWGDPVITQPGKTVLDRIHQTMILFASGRSDALKRFLVDEGIGADPRFWTLAQALSALYPPSTDEKRWVDGVLARKKGLGF